MTKDMTHEEMVEALEYALAVSESEGGRFLEIGCRTGKALLAALSSPRACGGREPLDSFYSRHDTSTYGMDSGRHHYLQLPVGWDAMAHGDRSGKPVRVIILADEPQDAV